MDNNQTSIKRILPPRSLIHFDQSSEMVCGKCGPGMHGIYLIATPDPTSGFIEPLGVNPAECAACSQCNELRPLNKRANELLFALGITSNSEYLSWSDGNG